MSDHPVLPKTLALVDDDKEYAEYLAQFFSEQGVQVDVFSDSNDLLTQSDPYGYGFYLVDLMLPGIAGADLIKLLRRRSDAGVVVVSGRLGAGVFTEVMTAGADMYLAKPVQFEQVALAVATVQRRAAAAVGAAVQPWKLDLRGRHLVAPDGARVDLSDGDLAVLNCFVEAAGEPVSRETLRQRLGRPADPDAPDAVNATIFRLRRRIERATPLAVPLQSRSRVGYVFKAPLKTV